MITQGTRGDCTTCVHVSKCSGEWDKCSYRKKLSKEEFKRQEDYKLGLRKVLALEKIAEQLSLISKVLCDNDKE